MGIRYFRRYRMEFDFARGSLPQATLPAGYHWLPWHRRFLDRHSLVKFASFQAEIDSQVFPCLGELDGCRKLMREICKQSSFLPQATWLITHRFDDWGEITDCATIQGLGKSPLLGAVQNVGVVPEHRGHGLGRALVLKALEGFQAAGLKRVYLEVTAENKQAVALYQSIGFRLTRTLYKAVSTPPQVAAAT
jgi:ribosomal protein S18 acetylase RimI-like enzyme